MPTLRDGPLVVDEMHRRALRRSRVARGLLVAALALPSSRIDDGPVLCLIRRLTGKPCPGCGLTRSVVKTVHGSPGLAAHDHPGGPALVAMLVCWAVTGTAHAGSIIDPGELTASASRRAGVTAGVTVWCAWALGRALSTSSGTRDRGSRSSASRAIKDQAAA